MRYGFHSLRFKLVLASVVVEVIMLAVLVWNSARITDNALKEMFQNRVETLVPMMNGSLAGPLVQRDYATLDERLGRIMHQDSLVYIGVHDELNRLVAKRGDVPARERLDDTFEVSDHIFDQAFDITVAGRVIGHAHYGLNVRILEATLASQRTQGMTLALIEILLTCLLLAVLGYLLTRHLRALARTAQALENGDYAMRVPVVGQDEVAETAQAFNAMAENVQRDIAARKLAEAVLREREEVLRLFVEHSPAAIGMFDTGMRYVVVSHRWMSDYGLGERNILGCSHYEIFPEIPQRWKDIHQRCLAGATERCEEDPFVRADGHTDWIKWEVCPWRKADGEIGGIIIFSESITGRKQAELALHESEERLRLALDAAHMGIFDWDIPNENITWSRWHEELWGFQPGEFDGTYEAFAQRVHPDDLPGINAEIARCIAGHEPFVREFRVVWPDASLHWVFSRGEFTFGAGDQPLRMLGAVVEVTKQKLAEERIYTQLDELMRWQQITLGRESRVRELKTEINMLLAQLGEAARYPGETV